VLSRFIARIAVAVASLVIGVIAGVIALAFFSYAIYLAFLNLLVPPAAAAITGVVVIAAAILLVGIVRLAFRPRRRRRTSEIPSLEECETAAEVGSELGRKIRGIAAANSGGGLLAALVAGFAVGVSPKLRAFLQAILKP
jgi:multisubunit Na+/H+ antiporter MnhB subunit